ncbi:MAG: FecR domain-containing protein [Bacteroidota bacterium]
MVTKELLEKYHSSLCSPEEEKQVKAWLATGAENLDLTPEKDDEKIRRQIWKSLLPTISCDSVQHIPQRKRVMRYAAAAIILFTAGFFAYQYSDDAFRDEASLSIAWQTIETQREEKRTVTLSDGSTIRMNYETQIKAQEKFEGDQRVVYLTGHAHFDIARDTERPFIIYTEDSKTQVLGTSFDINTREEGETEIIVNSGEVAFSEKEQADNLVKLTVNDRAILDSDKSISTGQVDAQKLTAWRENKLIFEGETLAKIIKVLEPWYHVTIEVKDSDLLTKDFILSRDNPPLTDVLARLGFIGGFEYTIEDNKVTLFTTE